MKKKKKEEHLRTLALLDNKNITFDITLFNISQWMITYTMYDNYARYEIS